jgi:SHAQKYF class myb-like DNA-binding protein
MLPFLSYLPLPLPRRLSRDKQLVHPSNFLLAGITLKAARLQWTPQLHGQFVRAVQLLGGPDKVSPKMLLEHMQVEGLTLFHIKSHLQKHRLSVKQGKEGLPTSSGGLAAAEEAGSGSSLGHDRSTAGGSGSSDAHQFAPAAATTAAASSARLAISPNGALRLLVQPAKHTSSKSGAVDASTSVAADLGRPLIPMIPTSNDSLPSSSKVFCW